MSKARHELFKILIDFYFDRKFGDIYFVPISISYDNVIGSGSLSQELVGESKIRASLKRTWNKVK